MAASSAQAGVRGQFLPAKALVVVYRGFLLPESTVGY